MTTAMIASNSFWVPRSVSAEPVDSTWIAAKSVAASAVRTNSVILVRATGTPRLRAAIGFAAAAKIQLPKRVRVSTQVKISGKHDPPDDRNRNALHDGQPVGALADDADSDKPAHQAWQNWPEKQASAIAGGQLVDARDLGPPGDSRREPRASGRAA